MNRLEKRLRAFGRSWIITALGLYDEDDLAVRDTEPCGPPSAPPVPVDPADDWMPPTLPSGEAS